MRNVHAETVNYLWVSVCGLFVGRHYRIMFSTLATLSWVMYLHTPSTLPTQAGSRSHSTLNDQCAISAGFPSIWHVLSSFLTTRLWTALWPLTLVEPILELVPWKSLSQSMYDCRFVAIIVRYQFCIKHWITLISCCSLYYSIAYIPLLYSSYRFTASISQQLLLLQHP